MKKEDKMGVVKIIDEKRAFLIKDSIILITKEINISHFPI